MKNWLCLILCIYVLFAITGCAPNGEASENNSVIPSSTNQTSTTTTTQSTDQELAIFRTSVASTSESETNSIADTTGVPYSNISADKLTDQEAREILEVLIPRQFDVFDLFQLDYQKIDKSHPLPINGEYVLCTDERFSCVQDIKSFILQVYSGKQAAWYFDKYLDGDVTSANASLDCIYLDYNGNLYRNATVEGKGLNYKKYLADTTRIVARTENTVTVEMDADYPEEGEPREIYKFLLCQTQDGWRLDSDFLDSYSL